MSQLPVGAQAPDFAVTGLDGRSHRLTEALKSGPLVLAFYKVDCPTSQFTFPFIQQIVSQAGKDKSWTIWGISQDDAQETRFPPMTAFRPSDLAEDQRVSVRVTRP